MHPSQPWLCEFNNSLLTAVRAAAAQLPGLHAPVHMKKTRPPAQTAAAGRLLGVRGKRLLPQGHLGEESGCELPPDALPPANRVPDP